MKETMQRVVKEYSEGLSKAPQNHVPQFTMTSPSTLSKAFENSPIIKSSSSSRGRGKSIVSCSEEMVDLNLALPAAAEADENVTTNDQKLIKVSPTCTRYPMRARCPKEGSSSGTNKNVLTLEEAIAHEMKSGRKVDQNIDPKKLRRTISNRLSAQRSRLKKAKHITEMEQKIKELQDTISFLTPQIENYKHKQKMLRLQKTILEQELSSGIRKSTLCNIQIEENKREVHKLKEVQKIQREQMIICAANSSNAVKEPFMTSSFTAMQYGDLHQLMMPTSNIHHHYNYDHHHHHHHQQDMTHEINTDQAMVDQYINFEALNIHPPKHFM